MKVIIIVGFISILLMSGKMELGLIKINAEVLLCMLMVGLSSLLLVSSIN